MSEKPLDSVLHYQAQIRVQPDGAELNVVWGVKSGVILHVEDAAGIRCSLGFGWEAAKGIARAISTAVDAVEAEANLKSITTDV